MADLTAGMNVLYYTDGGTARKGTVEGKAPVRGVIAVRLAGDPFAVCLPVSRLREEGSKEPRPEQKSPNQKGSTVAKKKSGSKNSNGKKERRKSSTSELVNPYREGSSMAFLFDALCEGGVVEDIAKKLIKKFPIKVRASEVDDEDEHIKREAAYRTLDVLKAADKAGMPTTKEGKGQSAFVKIG